MGIRAAVLRDELGIITFTLEQMGFDIVAFYEADPKTAEMCRRNLNCGCIQRDLLQCQETDLPQMELLIAQLPHQVFGEPGQRLGSGMGRELRKYLEIIHRKRPQVFLFETFPRVAGKKAFRELLSEIQGMGYQYTYRLCDLGEMTGLPVNEKRIYLVGVSAENGRLFQFPEKAPGKELPRRAGDICSSAESLDPWYQQVSMDMVDLSENPDTHFYCWRTGRYVEKDRIDWNLMKMPLVYDNGRLHKITHREMARLKGLPDRFCLDTSNKAWLYRKLAYGSNAIAIGQMAEAIRSLLEGAGIRNLQMVNGYRFENLLTRYFRNKGIECLDGYSDKGEFTDFVLGHGAERLYIEIKWYNSNAGLEGRILRVCARMQLEKEKRQGSYVLMTGSPVQDSFKGRCFEDYGVVIWDVKNLLWMFEEFPDIRNEFVSMLNYTIGDLVPEKPELVFRNKDGREEAKEENQGAEEKQGIMGQQGLEGSQDASASLREQLAAILPGKDGFARYEEVGTAILKYVFGDYLTLWEEQKRSNDDLYRFDLCCKVKHGNQPEFFDTVKEFFHTKYIVFEFKNYEKPITQKEIYTTEKYLYQKALRSVAIIISRKGADQNALSAARGCLRENGKLILCLSDGDLMELLQIKDEGERSAADYLGDMLDEMLIRLEK